MEFSINNFMLDSGMIDFSNMTSYEMGRNVLLPFLLSFIILWEVLRPIKLFNKKARLVISLGISLILTTTGSFIMMSEYISQVAGSSMVIVFGIVLIGGTILWGLRTSVDIYTDMDKDKAITKIRKKIAKLTEEYRSKKDPRIWEQIEELEKRMKKLEFEARNK